MQRRHADTIEPLRLTEQTRIALTSGEPPFWGITDRRAILRELIVHEDKLRTDRIHALYTLQGLLFASFGLLARGDLAKQVTIRAIVTLVAVVGITSARFYWQELQNNENAIKQILDDWDQLGRLFPDVTYPRLIGFLAQEKQRAASWLPHRAVPELLIFVWVAIAGFVWL